MTPHEQTYRLLNVGEVIQEGDEWFNISDMDWHRAANTGFPTFGTKIGGRMYRRILSQPNGFAAGSVQVIAKWLFERDEDCGPDALYHPNQPAHWAAAYEAEAKDLLASLAAHKETTNEPT